MITTEGEQRIRLLPEHLINQIAAGEVILRPASVIKELGENAIDAEATQITFWTESGGKERIQVSDNGIGMSAIDAELCFERHATSKIHSLKDLYRLRTKGFRGEALASIAAVAEVELFTRRAQDALGTYVRLAFGKKERTEPVRCAPGTTLIVRKLFHRLPARRKSLRQEETEHRYNLQEFLRLAYPHPERHFQFYHNHTLVYDLPPASQIERILALHPRLTPETLIPISEETPFFHLKGYLLAPERTPPRNKENYLFLNSRYIRHVSLQQTIHHTYETLLPAETRPLYWLFLEVPPEKVDVNISPSKTEVRLLEEMEIRRALVSVLRRAVALGKVPITGSPTASPIPLATVAELSPLPSEPVSPSLSQPS
ncbi:MAG: DNA mismatch repair endonuclease MutL, partial [Bacteroidia bacterium]|nr:DNA mismatch repair endonuclease MutL [Bacteroidia bacterium]